MQHNTLSISLSLSFEKIFLLWVVFIEMNFFRKKNKQTRCINPTNSLILRRNLGKVKECQNTEY
jgi:hypothetical protein